MSDAVITGAAALHVLQRELDACLAEVMRLARSAAHATRGDWRALVDALIGSKAPLPPANDGANPAEVRAVLIAVQALYDTRLHALERRLTPDERDEVDDDVWTFRHRRLSALVADELAAYIKIAAPRPTIARAFAKAAANTVTVPVRVDSHVQMHRCGMCGAPRRSDGLYGNCLYCGRALFNPRQEIE
jgi:hypothetical protein